MALLKTCDRCDLPIQDENQIGIVVGFYRLIPEEAYIRPSERLLAAAKQEIRDLEYFPIKWKEDKMGQVDLCGGCFDEFMKLPSPLPETN